MRMNKLCPVFIVDDRLAVIHEKLVRIDDMQILTIVSVPEKHKT